MSNQLRVDVVNDMVVFPDSHAGIDTTNIIANIETGSSYTVVADCWAVCSSTSWSSTLEIDGVMILVLFVRSGDSKIGYVPLKKGQTVRISEGTAKAYGLKY